MADESKTPQQTGKPDESGAFKQAREQALSPEQKARELPCRFEAAAWGISHRFHRSHTARRVARDQGAARDGRHGGRG
jgi:hypothetical protein